MYKTTPLTKEGPSSLDRVGSRPITLIINLRYYTCGYMCGLYIYLCSTLDLKASGVDRALLKFVARMLDRFLGERGVLAWSLSWGSWMGLLISSRACMVGFCSFKILLGWMIRRKTNVFYISVADKPAQRKGSVSAAHEERRMTLSVAKCHNNFRYT